MGKKYISYEDGLKNLNLEKLEKRRENICLKFAKNCLRTEKAKGIFKIKKSEHKMEKRKKRPFEEKMIKTKRYENLAVPFMTKLLNKEAQAKHQYMKNYES